MIFTTKSYLEEDNLGGYNYYHHSQYPLKIEYELYNREIHVFITQYYKAHINKEKEFKSKLTGTMSRYQLEDYILDCVELFLKPNK